MPNTQTLFQMKIVAENCALTGIKLRVVHQASTWIKNIFVFSKTMKKSKTV